MEEEKQSTCFFLSRIKLPGPKNESWNLKKFLPKILIFSRYILGQVYITKLTTIRSVKCVNLGSYMCKLRSATRTKYIWSRVQKAEALHEWSQDHVCKLSPITCTKCIGEVYIGKWTNHKVSEAGIMNRILQSQAQTILGHVYLSKLWPNWSTKGVKPGSYTCYYVQSQVQSMLGHICLSKLSIKRSSK